MANSWSHNGDDCVPLFALSEQEDSYDVLVENVHCECGTNGPVVILGSGHHSVRDVLFRNMTVVGTNQGAGGKIGEVGNTPMGSFANITYRDITITRPRYAGLYVNTVEEDAPDCSKPPPPEPAGWLHTQGMLFQNITADLSRSPEAVAGCFKCTAATPCQGLVFDNVQISGSHAPYRCYNANATVAGSTFPKPC